MKRLAKVHIIQPGYAIWSKKMKAQKADGTISMVISSVNAIIDTGLPKDKTVILKSLTKFGLTPEDIDYVICTHGDADHISNNNLFPKAKLIVGFDIYKGDSATFFQHSLRIDSNITVSAITGHDDRSIGVTVSTSEGIVVITGDLFEYKNDYKDIGNWIAFSKEPKQHIKNRAKVWEMADYIVPGHGNIFKVDKSIDLLELETNQLKKFLQKKINVYSDVDL
jgi:glyoxylase-like metal-dependent hydrolase (beta-lactamase superfamily II)